MAFYKTIGCEIVLYFRTGSESSTQQPHLKCSVHVTNIHALLYQGFKCFLLTFIFVKSGKYFDIKVKYLNI